MTIDVLEKVLRDTGPTEAVIQQCADDLDAARGRQTAAQAAIDKVNDSLTEVIHRQMAVSRELIDSGKDYSSMRTAFFTAFGVGKEEDARRAFTTMRAAQTRSDYLTLGLNFLVSGTRGDLDQEMWAARISETEARRDIIMADACLRQAKALAAMSAVWESDSLAKLDLSGVQGMLEEARQLDKDVSDLKSQKAEALRRLAVERTAVGI